MKSRSGLLFNWVQILKLKHSFYPCFLLKKMWHSHTSNYLYLAYSLYFSKCLISKILWQFFVLIILQIDCYTLSFIPGKQKWLNLPSSTCHMHCQYIFSFNKHKIFNERKKNNLQCLSKKVTPFFIISVAQNVTHIKRKNGGKKHQNWKVA